MPTAILCSQEKRFPMGSLAPHTESNLAAASLESHRRLDIRLPHMSDPTRTASQQVRNKMTMPECDGVVPNAQNGVCVISL